MSGADKLILNKTAVDCFNVLKLSENWLKDKRDVSYRYNKTIKKFRSK